MHVHVVFAHPTHLSFTGDVLASFQIGLEDAGHTHSVSDLYAMRFQPVIGAPEYAREVRQLASLPIPPDVAEEQAKLNRADAWAFVYPVWWTDCPAILKGWFDRVWTVGYAYAHGNPDWRAMESNLQLRPARKAIVLATAGHTPDLLRQTGCYQAMETTMIADRIGQRAKEAEFRVLGGAADIAPEAWELIRPQLLDTARDLGYALFDPPV
ncbi:MAG: NAD(P)H-dependent oxidoreductase [Actinomycetia bacterium]|nr:NAD(P)H-dependent oxidoreductase [Actinomycetes bacterium]